MRRSRRLWRRVEGPWDNYRGVNVWGGNNGLHPAGVNGKSWGIIATNGELYMWVPPGSPLDAMRQEARVYCSTDYAATWQPAPWAFRLDDGLMLPTICQFGKDYAGARGRYVYHYFIHPSDFTSDHIQSRERCTWRSPKDRLIERDVYEFFAGTNRPRWTRDVAAKLPVFEDRRNGVGWVLSVTRNAGLKRYLLLTGHTVSNRGNPGIFDAPEPWVPWTTAVFLNESDGTNFGAGRLVPNTFFWNIPTKLQSADGKEFTMVFTGFGRGKDNDSFNLVQGRLIVRNRR